jgi:hypothetical protein
MSDCYTGIVIPTPIVEICNGEYKSTDCIKTPNAIIYLDLPEGATQTQINAAIITFLVGKDAQIADLQSQINALELRVITLENP